MKENNKVLDVALPVVAQMTVYTFMSIFDVMMMGKYGGRTAVSVLGLNNAMINTFVDIFISSGICIGIISLISRLRGAREYNKSFLCAYNGLILGICIALIITLAILLFGKKILYMMGARNNILDLTFTFSKINAASLFFYTSSSIINSIFIAYGKSMIPFITSIIQFLVKISLNYFFMFKLFKHSININIGAISSLICYVIGFIFCFFKMLDLKKQFLNVYTRFKLNFNIIKEILYLSIPSSLEQASYGMSRLICTSIIMYSGTLAFSANEIANTIESISVTSGIGFGIANTTLVGINIGKKDYKASKKVSYDCLFLALFVMCSFSIIFTFMPNILIKFFKNKGGKEIIYLAGRCLVIGAFEQPFIAISAVFAGALKGLGDTKTPFYISTFTGWCIRLPLIYCFIYLLKHNILAVWWITTIQWVIDGILMFICFIYKIHKAKGIV